MLSPVGLGASWEDRTRPYPGPFLPDSVPDRVLSYQSEPPDLGRRRIVPEENELWENYSCSALQLILAPEFPVPLIYLPAKDFAYLAVAGGWPVKLF